MIDFDMIQGVHPEQVSEHNRHIFELLVESYKKEGTGTLVTVDPDVEHSQFLARLIYHYRPRGFSRLTTRIVMMNGQVMTLVIDQIIYDASGLNIFHENAVIAGLDNDITVVRAASNEKPLMVCSFTFPGSFTNLYVMRTKEEEQ